MKNCSAGWMRAGWLTVAVLVGGNVSLKACTGISLKSGDGAVICARTVEWAAGDAGHDTLVMFTRDHPYVATTPGGENGLRWRGRHGFVSLTAYGQDYGPDGLNEAGLYVGMYYFPGHASFAAYNPATAGESLSVGDLMRWMLSSFTSVEEVKENLGRIRVVHVEDPRFGGAPLPFHWKAADAKGTAIVIEIVEGGRVMVHDALLGVITNAPEYEWHLTNLRNYLGLSGAPRQAITLEGQRLTPLGGGSGLLGLPGDFTPPSRFVRAVALTASARELARGEDAVFEAFRILDGFNIPVGVTEAADKVARDIVSATQITTAADLRNRVFYFHTMHNRRVQKLDLKRLDFGRAQPRRIRQGAVRSQDVLEIVPDP